MKKIFLFFLLSVNVCLSWAQSAKEMQETANLFMRQNDYANAILVLNRAAAIEPQNMSVQKDLSLAYNHQKQNDKALDAIKKVLDSEEADDQSFQIAGIIYKDLVQPKDAEKIYKRGIKKYPASGPLYSELGELMMAQQDFSAIKQWEKGIEVDPSYSKNYFNAAKFYYLTTDPLWSLIYGEIFINMEPFSNRTPEMKNVLLAGYKKLFSSTDLTEGIKNKNSFEYAVRETLGKQSSVATYGINTSVLTMIRTRFILDWFHSDYANKYSFQLFDYQKDLLRSGLFEAYDQWVFGSVENLSAYQTWVNTHAEDNKALLTLQKNRILKFPTGQYYK